MGSAFPTKERIGSSVERQTCVLAGGLVRGRLQLRPCAATNRPQLRDLDSSRPLTPGFL